MPVQNCCCTHCCQIRNTTLGGLDYNFCYTPSSKMKIRYQFHADIPNYPTPTDPTGSPHTMDVDLSIILRLQYEVCWFALGNDWVGSSDGLVMEPYLTTGNITEVNPNSPSETEITTFDIDGTPAPNPYVYAYFEFQGWAPYIIIVADKSMLSGDFPYYQTWTYMTRALTNFNGRFSSPISLSPSMQADRVFRNIGELQYSGAYGSPATFDGSLTVDMLDNHCCVDENGICRSGIMDVDGSCLIGP